MVLGCVRGFLGKKIECAYSLFNAGWSGSGISSWVSSAEDSSATPSEFITYPEAYPTET
jgi:hypothetical protein